MRDLGPWSRHPPGSDAGQMNLDSAGLEVLSREESLDLLASVPLGRIAITQRALPAVLPVNFVLDDDSVVIRTGEGSKLAAATRRAVVAFEADWFDEHAETGWSVMVLGRSRKVDDEAEIARLAGLPLRPWVPGGRDHFIRVAIEEISGRRIRKGRPSGSDGYSPLQDGAVVGASVNFEGA